MLYLFRVEDRFRIRGRGTILTPGVPPDFDFPPGTLLVIECDDGTQLEGRGYREMAVRAGRVPVLVCGVDKDDIPLGATVWRKET